MIKQQFLTIPELTLRLGLSTRAIMELIRRGALPAYRFGSEVRIRKDDYALWLKNSRINVGRA